MKLRVPIGSVRYINTRFEKDDSKLESFDSCVAG
jgi:hypothetical protein